MIWKPTAGMRTARTHCRVCEANSKRVHTSMSSNTTMRQPNLAQRKKQTKQCKQIKSSKFKKATATQSSAKIECTPGLTSLPWLGLLCFALLLCVCCAIASHVLCAFCFASCALLCVWLHMLVAVALDENQHWSLCWWNKLVSPVNIKSNHTHNKCAFLLQLNLTRYMHGKLTNRLCKVCCIW